ncbi:MAG: putative metallopeptidase [Bacillota bacterium]
MAKAEKFHSEGTASEYNMLSNMISAHHKDFKDTEILILMKHGGWKSKGKTVFAKFKVLGDDLRSTWDKDAILYLNADMWNRTSEPQKKYILDHALFSLDLKQDKHGSVLEAMDGRPLLKSIPPDIEAYVEVIRRHGTITEDVKRLARALTETNQLTFEEVAAATEEEAPPAPPREGIRGTVNPDGTVNVYDKNQLTLEEAAAAAEKENDPMHGVGNDSPVADIEVEDEEESESDNNEDELE